MKNQSKSIDGKNVKVGDLLVNRLIPNDFTTSVGPFLLLDHGYPVTYKSGNSISANLNEHPHAGLIAFTYIIRGEVEHFDSLGNHNIAGEGGAHWLYSGSGVIHGERVSARLIASLGTFHTLQFWINIPASRKKDPPLYIALNDNDFPVLNLPDHSGGIRVLLGKCGSNAGPVESHSGEFLYRVTLNAKSECKININENLSRAVFIPDDAVVVNGEIIGGSRLLIAGSRSEMIVLRNPGISAADAFILGGPDPAEPVIVEGPFVMNSQEDIAGAYRDFFSGAYGTIARE